MTEPYTDRDIAGICYIAINVIIDGMIPAIISPQEKGRLIKLAVAEAIVEAQRIYNTTGAKDKLHFELQHEGMPQSWKVSTDGPLLPSNSPDNGHDYGEFNFQPKFG